MTSQCATCLDTGVVKDTEGLEWPCYTCKLPAHNPRHTLGPWRVELDGQHRFVIVGGPSRAMIDWHRQNGTGIDPDKSFSATTICRLGIRYNGSGAHHGPAIILDPVEAEQNANLISAVPQMLAALLQIAKDDRFATSSELRAIAKRAIQSAGID